MSPKSSPSPADEAPTRGAPGRPKDLAKRAAILEAAKAMFTQHGYAGASMDQIAAQAGVSKLTVYSHFGDKESLYGAVVRAFCDQQLPEALFDADPALPMPAQLQRVGCAFFAMVSSDEAIAGHRILCSPEAAGTPLPAVFWEAGPQRIQALFAGALRRWADAGELDIPDPMRAASQFFTLLKGDAHARLVFGCGDPADDTSMDDHVAATVDMFLRAYARDRGIVR